MVREREREICKEKARLRFSVMDFFFTVEALPIIVKYFNNCSKIGIACLRKGKLHRRSRRKTRVFVLTLVFTDAVIRRILKMMRLCTGSQ